MGGLSDLDFSLGLEIQRLVRQCFNSTVSPSSASPKPFILVASFGRSSIRLNEDSVSLILQSCLGGVASDFRVLHLSDYMFRFSVSSKSVGLMVYKLKFFKCELFAIFFSLWSSGGPHWQRELECWTKDQDAEWSVVQLKHSKKSYAQVVRSSGAFHHNPPRRSVFSRLHFATDEDVLRAAGIPSDHTSVHTPIHAHRRVHPKFKKSEFPIQRAELDLLCSHCLTPGHRALDCVRKIRCKSCFHYGHIARSCLSRAHLLRAYRPKSLG